MFLSLGLINLMYKWGENISPFVIFEGIFTG